MSADSRIETLMERHKELEMALRAEEKHAMPDQEKITQLKRQKLSIKDEISRLEAVAA